jgi:hypothetical protein
VVWINGYFFASVEGAATVFAFFACFTFFGAVLVVVAGVAVLWVFLAAGAAIRKGTATTVKSVELISLFILFSPSTLSGGILFPAHISTLPVRAVPRHHSDSYTFIP